MGRLILVVALAAVVTAYSQAANIRTFLNRSICDVPIRYHVGIVDARFNVSKDEFLTHIFDATKIWEEPIGKDVFTYDPDGLLTINLVFDERQSLHTQISGLEQDLKGGRSSLEGQIGQYDRLSQEFNKKLTDFNNHVDFWNSQGGAPRDEYEKLKKEEEELKGESDRLNSMAKGLKLQTRDYNTEVGKLNKTVETFNEALKVKPEEGLYDPTSNTIAIYFNISRDELVHTLAHELGHARGLAHLANPDTIMYPSTTELVVASSDDVAALSVICQRNYWAEEAKRLLREYSLRKEVRK